MSIEGIQIGTHIPYPDPDFRFAPEGRFVATGSVTGDASGGTAQVRIRTDRSAEFLYILDSLAADCQTGDGGDGLMQYLLYHGEHEVARDLHYSSQGTFNSGHGRRYFRSDLTPPAALLGAQRGDGNLISLCRFNWEVNVNTLVYTLGITGRYYRRNLVHQPGFLRAVLEGRA